MHGYIIEISTVRGHDVAYDVAHSVGARTEPGDLIVTTGGHRLFLTIPYFGERETFSVFHHLLNVEQPPSPDLVLPADEDYGEGRPGKDAVFAALDARIQDTCARGDAIYLVGVDMAPERTWDSVAEVDLEPADFDRFTTEPT